MTLPIDINPAQLSQELLDLNRRLSSGWEKLRRIRDDDVKLGQTPKEVVYAQDKMRLYRFKPLAKPAMERPVLIVYSLVSRHTMTDLQEDRSMIRNLLLQGLDVYLIDWGYPTPVDRWLTTGDYVNGYIDDCVEHLLESHEIDSVNLLGICQGGVLGLCYAALNPERVKNLILMVTPVDFHADMEEENKEFGFVNLWHRNTDVDLMVDTLGNIPGDFMAWSFSQTKPLANLAKYATSFIDVLDDDEKLMYFLRMEKWIADNPDFAGEACRQWMKDLYQQNKLVKGEFELDGRRVNLADITMPVLNIYADKDHLVPPKTTTALAKHVGTKDYKEVTLPGGHIGVYVGGRTQKTLAPMITDWLRKRQ